MLDLQSYNLKVSVHSHGIELFYFLYIVLVLKLQTHIHVWRKSVSHCHGRFYDVLFRFLLLFFLVTEISCNVLIQISKFA
jgi:hypothetical protein